MSAGTEQYEKTYGKITDENLAQLKDRIGVPLRPTRFGTPIPEATENDIRTWAWGIGDDNPLYMDGEYGAASRWGTLLAPPSILLAMDAHRLGHMTGMPGVHGLLAGMNWEWFRQVRLGDGVKNAGRLLSVDERTGQRIAARAIKTVFETRVDLEDGNPVGRMEHIVSRYERSGARKKGKYMEKSREIPYQWSKEEYEDIAARYRAEPERRRGRKKRYFEEVEPGDEIPEIIKGPLTVTSVVAFTTAVRPMHLMMAHRIMYQFFDRHPGAAIPNSYGAPEPAISVHWSPDHARFSGLPTAYDFGMERSCWAINLITDWMGDDAVLRAFRVSFKGMNYYGDLTTFSGRVEEKIETDNLKLVRCSFRSTNQRDETTTVGQALVALPSLATGLPEERILAQLPDALDLLPISKKSKELNY